MGFKMEKKSAAQRLNSVQISSAPMMIAILGTGDFGKALGRKIYETCPKKSVSVVFGSRNPQKQIIPMPGSDYEFKVLFHQDAIAIAGGLSFGHLRVRQIWRRVYYFHDNFM